MRLINVNRTGTDMTTVEPNYRCDDDIVLSHQFMPSDTRKLISGSCLFDDMVVSS